MEKMKRIAVYLKGGGKRTFEDFDTRPHEPLVGHAVTHSKSQASNGDIIIGRADTAGEGSFETERTPISNVTKVVITHKEKSFWAGHRGWDMGEEVFVNQDGILIKEGEKWGAAYSSSTETEASEHFAKIKARRHEILSRSGTGTFWRILLGMVAGGFLLLLVVWTAYVIYAGVTGSVPGYSQAEINSILNEGRHNAPTMEYLNAVMGKLPVKNIKKFLTVNIGVLSIFWVTAGIYSIYILTEYVFGRKPKE